MSTLSFVSNQFSFVSIFCHIFIYNTSFGPYKFLVPLPGTLVSLWQPCQKIGQQVFGATTGDFC